MDVLKKNIWIYILVGIFLQPHIFNNLHFALVSHEHHWKFEISKQKSFHSEDKFHNCEQYLFKVPPVTEIDLLQEEAVFPDILFKEISGIETISLIQNINYSPHKRGPPLLI